MKTAAETQMKLETIEAASSAIRQVTKSNEVESLKQLYNGFMSSKSALAPTESGLRQRGHSAKALWRRGGAAATYFQ